MQKRISALSSELDSPCCSCGSPAKRLCDSLRCLQMSGGGPGPAMACWRPGAARKAWAAVPRFKRPAAQGRGALVEVADRVLAAIAAAEPAFLAAWCRKRGEATFKSEISSTRAEGRLPEGFSAGFEPNEDHRFRRGPTQRNWFGGSRLSSATQPMTRYDAAGSPSLWTLAEVWAPAKVVSGVRESPGLLGFWRRLGI